MKKFLSRKVTIIAAVIMANLIFLSGCTTGNNSISNNTQNNQNSTVEKTNNNNANSDTNSNINNSSQQTNTQNSDDPKNGTKPIKKNIKVKALYLTGWTVGSMNKVNHYIQLAKNTEINSYVVDIKDDDGYVGYESQIKDVRDAGAWMKKYNVDKVLKAFHDNNVHVIGRIVCFKDPVYSIKRPDLAIKNVNGGLWKDNNKITWLNPYNKDSWSYLAAIAKEAIQKGFDEIQFDYVRFPNEGNKKAMDFRSTDKQKYEAINEFLAYIRKEMPDITFSADVFGIICESPADSEGIGQYLELVGKDTDYLSPMLYPSHFANGQIVNNVKFAKPDFDPYNVVYNSLIKAKKRLSQPGSFKTTIRPYLQDFTASWLDEGYYQKYGAEQVRQQVKAVYDAGYEEWIFWDALNTYSESAY